MSNHRSQQARKSVCPLSSKCLAQVTESWYMNNCWILFKKSSGLLAKSDKKKGKFDSFKKISAELKRFLWRSVFHICPSLLGGILLNDCTVWEACVYWLITLKMFLKCAHLLTDYALMAAVKCRQIIGRTNKSKDKFSAILRYKTLFLINDSRFNAWNKLNMHWSLVLK